ncbi:MAG: chemotaxis protein CheW [Minwuia sp.]|nr:chemotaxis protein CheW [Minwuia sp.]
MTELQVKEATVGYPTSQGAASGVGGAEYRQFVSFTVGQEEYAVDIMQVREIKGWTEVTVLPNQPPYMRGVLNLRGLIVPIIDLRCRFGQTRTEATASHVVVIVALGDRIVGVLVDMVSDILTVNTQDIRAVPDMESRDIQDFLVGIVSANERMVAILAIERLTNTRALTDAAAASVAA